MCAWCGDPDGDGHPLPQTPLEDIAWEVEFGDE